MAYEAVPVLSSYSGLMVSETGVDWKTYFVCLGLLYICICLVFVLYICTYTYIYV